MKMNDAGLPLPGRELDLEIARILGYEVVEYHHDATAYPYVYITGDKRLYLILDSSTALVYPWTPSTTHAFFQAMEAIDAIGGVWSINERYNVGGESKRFRTMLWIPDGDGWITHDTGYINLSDYASRLKAYAHAVCCCYYLWKTQQ